ncbi:MAG: hypothetical protein J6U48_05745, partial [Alistipes sp.]|nr:hypothetical protein [Alistipes sp.]
PEEYGDYFAWGETSPKAEYSYRNYQHWVDYDGNGYWNFGEYPLNSDISGTQYDAATANWGGSWRMPTWAELQELVTACTWTGTSLNGVNGIEVTGPNGNSIILPAAGFRVCSESWCVGSNGYYWSSTPIQNKYNDSYFLDFELLGGIWDGRADGLSVRPVQNK